MLRAVCLHRYKCRVDEDTESIDTQEECVPDKEKEEFVIPDTDGVVRPGTIVVEFHDAASGNVAVMRAWRLVGHAAMAPPLGAFAMRRTLGDRLFQPSRIASEWFSIFRHGARIAEHRPKVGGQGENANRVEHYDMPGWA